MSKETQMSKETRYSMTITTNSLEKISEVFDKIIDIEGVEIFHHVKTGTKKEFHLMKDVGGNYEKC